LPFTPLIIDARYCRAFFEPIFARYFRQPSAFYAIDIDCQRLATPLRWLRPATASAMLSYFAIFIDFFADIDDAISDD
jgi:hypothetical protein